MKAAAAPCRQPDGEIKGALTTGRKRWRNEGAKHVRMSDDTEQHRLIAKPDGTTDRREWSERQARHLLHSPSTDHEDGGQKEGPGMSTRIFDTIWSAAEKVARAVFVAVVIAIWAPVGAMKGVTKIALMNEGNEEAVELWNRMSPWISGRTWFPWETESSEMPQELSAEVELDEMKNGSQKKDLNRQGRGRGQDSRRINGLPSAAKRSAPNAWKVGKEMNVEPLDDVEGASSSCWGPESMRLDTISNERSRWPSRQQWQESEDSAPAKKRCRMSAPPEMRMSTMLGSKETWKRDYRKFNSGQQSGPSRRRWRKQKPKYVTQRKNKWLNPTQEEYQEDGKADGMRPRRKSQESNWRLHCIKKNKSTKNKPTPVTKKTSSISGQHLIIMVLTILTLTYSLAAATSDSKDSVNSITYDPEDFPGVNLTVYDCRTPANGTYHAIDAVETGTCSSAEIEEDFQEPEVVKIHQFQVNTPVAVKVARCQLLLSKTIKWHGWDHGIYHMRNTANNVNIYLSRDTCLTAINGDRTITCPSSLCGGRPSHPIVVPENHTEYATWETRGSYNKLSADTESFRPNIFGQDGNVKEAGETVYGIETATLAITLEWVNGYVDFDSNTLSIPKLDTRADYSLTWVHHAKYGMLAWNRMDYSCKSSIGHIATVNATVRKVKEDRRKGENEYAGAMVIVEDHEEGRASGMLLTDERHPCITTHNCLRSNVKSLVACIGDEEVSGVDPIESKPKAQVLRMELAAGLTYVAFTEKVERAELARQIWAIMCLTWETLAHYARVALLDSSNRYSLRGLEIGNSGPPNMTQQSLVRGSMVYLSNCTGIQATLAVINVCSQQIPIMIGENVTNYEPGLYFADAITKQIVTLPSIIKCDDTLPVQYKIGQQWHCHSPKHRLCPQEVVPSKLTPNIGRGRGLTLENVQEVHLPLTPKQQKKHHDISDEQGMGPVIMDNVVRTVLDNSKHRTPTGPGGLGTSIHLGMPLTKEDVGNLTDLVAGKMFILFRVLGQFYLNIFGFMVVLSLCQYVFNSACRLYYTLKHNDYKFGWYLLRAFFAVLFSSAVLPARILKEAVTTVRKQLDEDKEEFLPDPDYAAWRDRLKHQEGQLERIRCFLLARGDDDEELQQILYTNKELEWSTKRKGERLYPQKELNDCKKKQEAADKGEQDTGTTIDISTSVQDSRKNFKKVFWIGNSKSGRESQWKTVSRGKAEEEAKEVKPSAPTDDKENEQGRFDDAQ